MTTARQKQRQGRSIAIGAEFEGGRTLTGRSAYGLLYDSVVVAWHSYYLVTVDGGSNSSPPVRGVASLTTEPQAALVAITALSRDNK